MKNIVSIILLFLISQSLLGDIRLRAPFPNNEYNHYKGVHVSCISDGWKAVPRCEESMGRNRAFFTITVNE